MKRLLADYKPLSIRRRHLQTCHIGGVAINESQICRLKFKVAIGNIEGCGGKEEGELFKINTRAQTGDKMIRKASLKMTTDELIGAGNRI